MIAFFKSRNPILPLISWCLGPKMFWSYQEALVLLCRLILYPCCTADFQGCSVEVLAPGKQHSFEVNPNKALWKSLYGGQWPQRKCLGSQLAHQFPGSLSPQQAKASQKGTGFQTVRKTKNIHRIFFIIFTIWLFTFSNTLNQPKGKTLPLSNTLKW